MALTEGDPQIPLLTVTLSTEGWPADFPHCGSVCLGILRYSLLLLSGERLPGSAHCGSKWGFSDICHCGFDQISKMVALSGGRNLCDIFWTLVPFSLGDGILPCGPCLPSSPPCIPTNLSPSPVNANMF